MINENNFAPISVVIPCFKCTETIVRAIKSIESQTIKPAEVILVEDASGDDTLDMLRGIEQQYSGIIKIIPLDRNYGAGSARNFGWRNAIQPYIAFLDADDSWHPDKLRIQYEYMKNNLDVVLCGHQCVFLNNQVIESFLPKGLCLKEISAVSLLFRNAFSTPSVMLKREIPFRFQEGRRYAEDLLLWQQIAFAGMRVVRIESPLAYIHKPLYGAGGLSEKLWEMEKGELKNLVQLYAEGKMNFLIYAASMCFSVVKYIKRVCVARLFKQNFSKV